MSRPADVLRYQSFLIWLSFITTGISAVLFVLVILCIIKTSISMRRYKWFLLNYAVWCFFTQISFALIIPVYLPPVFAFYALGPLKIIPPELAVNCIAFGISLIIWTYHSMFFSFLYRYLLTYPGRLSEFASSNVFLAIYIVHSLLTSAPCFYSSLVSDESPDVIHETIRSADPDLEIFFNESSLNVINYANTLKFVATPLTLGMVSLILSVTICCLGVIRYLQLRNKSSVVGSKVSHRILLIYNLIQTAISITFILIPACTLGFSFAFRMRDSIVFVNVVAAGVNLNCILQLALTLGMITPYREFLVILCRRTISNNDTVQSGPTYRVRGSSVQMDTSAFSVSNKHG